MRVWGITTTQFYLNFYLLYMYVYMCLSVCVFFYTRFCLFEGSLTLAVFNYYWQVLCRSCIIVEACVWYCCLLYCFLYLWLYARQVTYSSFDEGTLYANNALAAVGGGSAWVHILLLYFRIKFTKLLKQKWI